MAQKLIPFREVKVGQTFRLVVENDTMLHMKITAGVDCAGPKLPNTVEIKGPNKGYASIYSPVAMVELVE